VAPVVDRPTRSLDVLSYLGAQRRPQHLPRPIPADGVKVEFNALPVLFAGDYPQTLACPHWTVHTALLF
jgi:hypothetical protein